MTPAQLPLIGCAGGDIGASEDTSCGRPVTRWVHVRPGREAVLPPKPLLTSAFTRQHIALLPYSAHDTMWMVGIAHLDICPGILVLPIRHVRVSVQVEEAARKVGTGRLGLAQSVAPGLSMRGRDGWRIPLVQPICDPASTHVDTGAD